MVPARSPFRPTTRKAQRSPSHIRPSGPPPQGPAAPPTSPPKGLPGASGSLLALPVNSSCRSAGSRVPPSSVQPPRSRVDLGHRAFSSRTRTPNSTPNSTPKSTRLRSLSLRLSTQRHPLSIRPSPSPTSGTLETFSQEPTRAHRAAKLPESGVLPFSQLPTGLPYIRRRTPSLPSAASEPRRARCSKTPLPTRTPLLRSSRALLASP